ncbi:MAG: aminotransferase class V-fold PLP-dependent enzyme [Coriobacteriia bacterium]|nr:aminotransferase class V-fold PLP-dependent enzyme [Coriobacteriia bacterium]
MGEPTKIIYFDHAATSWPKPPVVPEAMVQAMSIAGGNPDRGAHTLALAAGRTIAHARGELAGLLGIPDERDLAFMPGCTAALNLVLKGALKHGDRVVVVSAEHNAVVRPLFALGSRGVKVARVPVDPEGNVDAEEVERAVASASTRMVICQHASNVTGAIQPIADLADIAHEHGAVMVSDGAQAAGHLPVDCAALGVDAYAIAGHKGLLGPQGIGALYLAPGFSPVELLQGGGGVSIKVLQPEERPDRYEAGTPNTPAIAGLGAAAAFVRAQSAALMDRERELTRRLHEGLLDIPALRVLGPALDVPRAPLVSVAHERISADEIAFALDSRFGIAVRAGLHCSPWTHAALGTLESGAVRFGLGWGLDEAAVDYALDAMREICSQQ